MKCAVHPEVDATGFCRNCGKAMCADCARPVREVLYCENCLAAGMGVAPPPAPADPYSQPSYSQPGYVPSAAVPPPQVGSGRGAVAFVLGMFPGLGAVYNGEYNKALIHIVVFAAMILGLASDDVGEGAKAFLGILLGGFVLYMAFDSMRVAQAKATGQPNEDPLNNLS